MPSDELLFWPNGGINTGLLYLGEPGLGRVGGLSASTPGDNVPQVCDTSALGYGSGSMPSSTDIYNSLLPWLVERARMVVPFAKI